MATKLYVFTLYLGFRFLGRILTSPYALVQAKSTFSYAALTATREIVSAQYN